MAVNKVEIDGEVKLDLTQDTVTEDTLLQGVTAHDAAGNPVEGKVLTTPVPKTSDLLKGDGKGGVSAATPGKDYLKEAPVTSVNGATGATKSTFYVTVTPTGSGYAATADKTPKEVYAAYTAGYAVYAVVQFDGYNFPFMLPLVSAASMFGTEALGFGALGSPSQTENPQYPTVLYDGAKWQAWIGTLAKKSDIPTALKNPNALNIKIGDTTTSYDGSAAKTVEIPEGGGTDESLGITGAAAGKIPKIKAVDAAGKPTAWEATALPDEAFIVYFTRDIQLEGDPILTSDRTPEEVIAAIASKKLVIALLEQDNKVTQLCNIDNNAGNLYFFTIREDGGTVGIGWDIDFDMSGGRTYTLTTMAPWTFIRYNGTTAPNQIFGTGDAGGYEFKQCIGFENLPGVTTSDNGKFMRVANGAWKAAEMPESGPTDAQVSSAVDTWLTEHPEATTTVQDGSVSAQKLAGYSTECRDIPWTLFLDGYGTTAGVKAENANCAIYSVKFEAGKTYCLTQLPYPVNTNEFVTDPSDIANFGWYHAYPSLPDAAEALENGRFAFGVINTIMKKAVSDGYIEPAISGQTLAGIPAYFTVKQDWYLLRASVKPDAGKRINNCFVAEVPAGMSDIGNGMDGQSWYVFKKDLGNGYARDEGYLQQIFASKTANAENERAYAAMSRDVPRDRTLSIQFIGDSITYAASNAGWQNAFRKYVPMNLRAETMALCQNGASVTTGSGSFDWNGKQNTNAAYDAAMSGYSGLAQKLAEYKTNLSLKMWADAVDIVVVELGTNDHWEQATLGVPTDLTEDTNFYGAVEKTLTLLEDTFPHAQIMWLLPFKNQNWKTSTVKMVDYLIALKILCQMHTRCWVLDLFDKWFLNYDDADVRSKFFRDSVHITGDAHKCVAESMIDKIRQIISVCGLRQIETMRVTNANDSVYGSANT